MAADRRLAEHRLAGERDQQDRDPDRRHPAHHQQPEMIGHVADEKFTKYSSAIKTRQSPGRAQSRWPGAGPRPRPAAASTIREGEPRDNRDRRPDQAARPWPARLAGEQPLIAMAISCAGQPHQDTGRDQWPTAQRLEQPPERPLCGARLAIASKYARSRRCTIDLDAGAGTAGQGGDGDRRDRTL